MFFTKDYQTLHLKSFEYNAALILREVKEIVITNGGRVKNGYHPGYIVNGTLDDAIRETSEKIAQIEAAAERTEDDERRRKQTQCINELRKKLTKYQSVNNESVLIETPGTYIEFVLNSFYYCYQMDENPFFEFYFIKAPIINGAYSQNYICDEDKKEWLFDCFFKCDCTNAERKKAANFIFDMLINSDTSKYCRKSKRVRVSNLYDGGYHYENKLLPERLVKIDF